MSSSFLVRTLIPAALGATLIFLPNLAAQAQDNPPEPPVTVDTLVGDVQQAIQDTVDKNWNQAVEAFAALTGGAKLPIEKPIVPSAPVTTFELQAFYNAAPEPVKGLVKKTAADAAATVRTVTIPMPVAQGDPALDGEGLYDVRRISVPLRSDGPNYHWKADPVSQLLAVHAGPVLHRMQGSFFNAPDIPLESYAAESVGRSLFGPGTPIYLGLNRFCTLGVAGYDRQGNIVGITAGHCGKPGDKVYSADSWPNGVSGEVVASNEGEDYSLIRFDRKKAVVSRSYNGVTVNRVGQASPNAMLCKMGVATGWTCGSQETISPRQTVAKICAMRGDSGAPVLEGDTAVAIVSKGALGSQLFACRTPLQGPFFQPTVTQSLVSITGDLDTQGGIGAGFVLPDTKGRNPLLSK